ncbi:hypothetical protein KAU15_02910 [candidate division WOR-3 bacterium]|nr:hypothetical protein [candidate division WOR-3 bacterium]
MKERIKTINSIFKFIFKRKKYWLLPVILIILLVAALLFVFANSSITPFIYTIF